MSRITKILAGAVAGALAFTGAANAATVTITPTIVNYFATQTDLDNSTPAASVPANNAAAGIYEVRYSVQTVLTGADTTAGFTGIQNLFFDAISSSLPAHLAQDLNNPGGANPVDFSLRSNTTFLGYRYDDPIAGTTDAGSGSNTRNSQVWTVSDNGAVGDLKALSYELPTGVFAAADGRNLITQTGQNANITTLVKLPTGLFDVFLSYDGLGTATLTPSAGTSGDGFALHNNTTGLGTFFNAGSNPLQAFAFNPVTFGAGGDTPEPTSLAFLGLGGLMALRRRRA